MTWARWALASTVLLAVQRALTILVSLLILLSLIALLAPRAQLPAAEPGLPGAAMDGENGDAESDPRGPYMTFDLFWELPAQGPNVSEASRAGLKNETGVRNNSWPLMEPSGIMALLKETIPVLEGEPVDKEEPQEGPQAVPDPGESMEDLQPTGVHKRSEDATAEPNPAESLANSGKANAKLTWSVFLRAFLVSVVCSLLALLLLKVAPAWANDIKERLAALRASFERLDEAGDKDLVLEI